MWLCITAYTISWTFNMTSCPRQPRLAMHCQLLLFCPIINIPQCLWDRIQDPEGPDNRYTGLSSAKRSWPPYHRDTKDFNQNVCVCSFPIFDIFDIHSITPLMCTLSIFDIFDIALIFCTVFNAFNAMYLNTSNIKQCALTHIDMCPLMYTQQIR